MLSGGGRGKGAALLLENKLLCKQLLKDKAPVEMKQLSTESGWWSQDGDGQAARSISSDWNAQRVGGAGLCGWKAAASHVQLPGAARQTMPPRSRPRDGLVTELGLPGRLTTGALSWQTSSARGRAGGALPWDGNLTDALTVKQRTEVSAHSGSRRPRNPGTSTERARWRGRRQPHGDRGSAWGTPQATERAAAKLAVLGPRRQERAATPPPLPGAEPSSASRPQERARYPGRGLRHRSCVAVGEEEESDFARTDRPAGAGGRRRRGRTGRSGGGREAREAETRRRGAGRGAAAAFIPERRAAEREHGERRKRHGGERRRRGGNGGLRAALGPWRHVGGGSAGRARLPASRSPRAAGTASLSRPGLAAVGATASRELRKVGGGDGPFPSTRSERPPARAFPLFFFFFFTPPLPSLFNSAPSQRPAPRNLAFLAAAGRGGRAGRCPGPRRRERPSRKMRCVPCRPRVGGGGLGSDAGQGRAEQVWAAARCDWHASAVARWKVQVESLGF